MIIVLVEIVWLSTEDELFLIQNLTAYPNANPNPTYPNHNYLTPTHHIKYH